MKLEAKNYGLGSDVQKVNLEHFGVRPQEVNFEIWTPDPMCSDDGLRQLEVVWVAIFGFRRLGRVGTGVSKAQ